MSERYLPRSEFLNHVIAGEIPFEGLPHADANLTLLLGMVSDPDRSNRDWATFVIAGLPCDTPDIRAALMTAAHDADPDTRDEAIVGLARRDRGAALDRLVPLLGGTLGTVLLEAATILGDTALVPALRAIERWEGDDDQVRDQLRRAIAACEAGVGIDDWPDAGEPAYHLTDAG